MPRPLHSASGGTAADAATALAPGGRDEAPEALSPAWAGPSLPAPGAGRAAHRKRDPQPREAPITPLAVPPAAPPALPSPRAAALPLRADTTAAMAAPPRTTAPSVPRGGRRKRRDFPCGRGRRGAGRGRRGRAAGECGSAGVRGWGSGRPGPVRSRAGGAARAAVRGGWRGPAGGGALPCAGGVWGCPGIPRWVSVRGCGVSRDCGGRLWGGPDMFGRDTAMSLTYGVSRGLWCVPRTGGYLVSSGGVGLGALVCPRWVSLGGCGTSRRGGGRL